MADEVIETSVWGVNERGEIVAATGKGSQNVIGYISEASIPQDDKGRVVLANVPTFAYDASGNPIGVQGATGVIPFATRRIKSASAFQAPILNHATNTYNFCGFDPIDGVVWVRDDSGGMIRQGTTSDAWATTAGVTWSSNKTLPALPNAVLYSGVMKMIRFGAYVYLLAKDSVTNIYGIYRALPASGSTAFSWSAPLQQMTSSTATALYTSFYADATYMYLLEYGDPVGGPTAWRSADGTTWTQIYTEVGQTPNQRHGHAITPDPYVPGSVWITLGDANAPREILRSTDYGTTWSVFEANAAWQAVQISFTPTHIFFAGDSARGHLFTVDKATMTKAWACNGLVKNLGVPAAAALGDTFYTNGWQGCVDPASGEYYFSLMSDAAGGNIPGFFYVPYQGAAPILLDKLSSVSSPVDIYAGMVWCGKQRRPLHTY